MVQIFAAAGSAAQQNGAVVVYRDRQFHQFGSGARAANAQPVMLLEFGEVGGASDVLALDIEEHVGFQV